MKCRKQHIFKKKSKVGKNEECTVTVKTATQWIGFVQYQTHQWASPEKWIGMLS